MDLRAILLRLGLLIAMGGGLTGCVAVKAVGEAGKLVGTTVIVATKTATTAVKTSGKVASSAIKGSGAVTTTSIESLAALAQVGMVTFVDVATGTIVRVPWQEGMTIYGGGAAAKVQVAQRAVSLVRGGRLAYASARLSSGNLRLNSGDVVQLAGRISR